MNKCLEKTVKSPSRLGMWVTVLLALTIGPPETQGANSGAKEYSVKAAFLFHFAQFVDWPDGTFEEADSPLVYCTIGADPFHGALEASLLGKKMGGRGFQVRHAKQMSELQGCHVLFIGEGEKAQLKSVLANIKGSPILTVGESEQFVNQGGMIGFCPEENKIRFEINLESAEKAQLRISARLLALAKIVIGRPRRS